MILTKDVETTKDLTMTSYNQEECSMIVLNGKAPIEKGWQKHCEEKRDLAEVIELHQTGQNLGIACGPASNMLVLDVDEIEIFETVCKKNGWIVPETLTVKTGSGGIHYYFNYPEDGNEYGNKSFKAKGFDIRGLGGQVVAPSSIHPDTGKEYEVTKDVPKVDAPEWFIELCLKDSSSGCSNESAEVDLTLLKKKLGETAIKYIENGVDKGERSEAIWHVLQELVQIGCDDNVWL